MAETRPATSSIWARSMARGLSIEAIRSADKYWAALSACQPRTSAGTRESALTTLGARPPGIA